MTATLLHRAVAERAAADGGRPAVREAGRTLTYAELDAAARRVRGALAAAGVGPGDRVAVHGDPSAAAVTTLLGVLAAGAVWTGMNPRHAPREHRDLLATTGPRLVVTLGPPPEDLADVAADAGLPLVTGGPAGPTGDWATTPADTAPPLPAGTAALVHTSGSTGTPKGALIGAAALAGACAVAAATWSGCLDAVLCDLPIDHIGFLGDIVGTGLVAASTIVCEPRFDPARTVHLIGAERVTAWTGVPAMFAAVLAEPSVRRADLSSVRRVFWGGGAMPAAVLAGLSELTRAPLTGVYGSTETVGNVAAADSVAVPDPDALAGRLGHATPPYRIRVVDGAGSPVATGETGAIEVDTPFGFSGYLARPDLTAAARTGDGWLRTGDLGGVEPDGAVTFRGRADGLIRSGGYFVNPVEVEQHLQRLPGVVEAVVVAAPDPDRGALPVAVVATNGAFDAADARRALRGVLAAYKVPRRIEVVAALPRLPLGKVDRAGVARRVTEGRP